MVGASSFANRPLTIYYDVRYGDQDQEWTEIANSGSYTSQNRFLFEYDVSQKEQQLTVKIAIEMLEDNPNYLEFNALNASQVSKPLVLWIISNFDILDCIMLKGEYQSSK